MFEFLSAGNPMNCPDPPRMCGRPDPPQLPAVSRHCLAMYVTPPFPGNAETDSPAREAAAAELSLICSKRNC